MEPALSHLVNQIFAKCQQQKIQCVQHHFPISDVKIVHKISNDKSKTNLFIDVGNTTIDVSKLDDKILPFMKVISIIDWRSIENELMTPETNVIRKDFEIKDNKISSTYIIYTTSPNVCYEFNYVFDLETGESTKFLPNMVQVVNILNRLSAIYPYLGKKICLTGNLRLWNEDGMCIDGIDKISAFINHAEKMAKYFKDAELNLFVKWPKW